MMTSIYMLARRYDLGMPHTSMYLPLCAFITSVRSSDSNTTAGDVTSSFFILVLCRLPSAHSLPLIDTSHFYFNNVSDLRAPLFCSAVSDP